MSTTILFDATSVNFSALTANFGVGVFPAPRKHVAAYSEGEMVLARDQQGRMVPARVEQVRAFGVGPDTFFVRYPDGYGQWLAENTVGVMIAPLRQADNTAPRHPADAVSIAEQTAHSIRMTEQEEAREAVMNAIRQADHDDAMDEMAARRLADLRYECMA